ncbi:hypothetical protein B0H14DRAFT_3446660 [Mycena olivaceomarginata]|nr:hypothetical protein B0H14DRAFT_3446660 [Mycena olivaceomarginata]
MPHRTTRKRGRQRPEPEPVIEWPTTLLASSLDPKTINAQSDCILLTRIPPEVRQWIYEMYFTAEQLPIQKAHPKAQFSFNKSWPTYPVVYTSLLRTCRAIYVEACTLPLSLNPPWAFQGSTSEESSQGLIVLPGGFAHFTSLVIVTQQSGLEQEPGHLVRYADATMAAERHDGLYVAAREGHGQDQWEWHMPTPRPFYQPPKKYLTCTSAPSPSLTSTDTDTEAAPPQYYHASPITHLTIRMDRADWWTWGDYPPRAPDGGLALDPGMGDGGLKRPSVSGMLAAADVRRTRAAQGLPPAPYPPECWGRRIGLFKDLTRLTLYLETFAWRVAELDKVVECAKTWQFPIGGEGDEGARVLAWGRRGGGVFVGGNADSEVRVISFR